MSHSELTEKQQYWLKHCRDYQSFSGSQKEYALSHDLKLTDFYSWRKILRDKGLITPIVKKREDSTAAPFSRIQVNTSPRIVGQVQLRTHQFTMTLPSLPEPQWLADFVLALESSS